MTPNPRLSWIRFCGVIAICLLVYGSLSGAAAQPRTVLGWELEHLIGYFAMTLIVYLAWPRPLLVAVGMAVLAFLLEGLQAFTPDRTPNLYAALIGAGGALVATLLSELVTRARRRRALGARGSN